MKKLLKITFTLIIITILLLGFAVPVNMVGNWYQQFLPNIGGRSITDVFFLDSLMGWSVTNATNQGTDTTYVLKTTNSGNNWAIQFRKVQTGGGFSGYFKVYFLNQNTGYTTDVRGIYKTTDGGSNWVSLNAPMTAYEGMSVLNTDTIWIVTSDSFAGGVFRTTNGGTSWQNQMDLGSQNPNKIYMINSNTGFISKLISGSDYTRKTTNSGLNWFVLTSGSGESFYDMYFADEQTGWANYFNTRKTTNGGTNWTVQPMPSGGSITTSTIEKFSGINKDTVYGVGAFLLTGTGFRGMINRTTNGGNNWLYQVPDTSTIQIGQYNYVDFVNKLNGWAYTTNGTGIHTTTGGDPVWYTGIQQISNNIPKEFALEQNYPNPFNPRTVIPYKLIKSAFVRLIAYEITGKETQIMVNQHQQAGEYEVDFMGKFSASGVYLYRLEVIDDKSKQLFTETKKMLLIK